MEPPGRQHTPVRAPAVLERPDGDGIQQRASRKQLESALLRRFPAAASLHALRGVPMPDYVP